MEAHTGANGSCCTAPRGVRIDLVMEAPRLLLIEAPSGYPLEALRQLLEARLWNSSKYLCMRCI